MNTRDNFKFVKHEDGAVTVDWVVLTAAVMLMGVSVITVVSDAALDESRGIGAHISAQTVATP